MEKIKYAIIGFGGIAENRIAKEGYGCDKARFNGIEHGVLSSRRVAHCRIDGNYLSFLGNHRIGYLQKMTEGIDNSVVLLLGCVGCKSEKTYALMDDEVYYQADQHVRYYQRKTTDRRVDDLYVR